MTLVASGLPNKQVGGEPGISEVTVNFHRGNLMRKMRAESFAHLVNMASRLRVARPVPSALIKIDPGLLSKTDPIRNAEC